MRAALFICRLRQNLAPVHDIVMAGLSLPLSLTLRIGIDQIPSYIDLLAFQVPLFCCITGVTFRVCGGCRHLWRYTSFVNVRKSIGAILVSVAVFSPLLFLLPSKHTVPGSVPLIQLLCLVVLIGGPRCIRRALYEARLFGSPSSDAERLKASAILVIGSGENTTLLLRALARKHPAPYCPVGILDLSEENVGRDVLTVPVVGTIGHLEEVVRVLAEKEQRPEKLVLARAVDRKTLITLRESAQKANVALVRLPDLTRFHDVTENNLLNLQPVVVEDLLPRPQVVTDESEVERLIEGRRVLITGAGGSIGSELSRQIARRHPAELALLDSCEYNLYAIDLEIELRCPKISRKSILCDIRDGERVARAFADVEPQLVFHAAALKHVPLVELNPIEGVRTNVFGTRNVATAAREVGALAFVQVSTDKAVNPTNVMGATKRMAERVCQALDVAVANKGDRGTRFLTVRFGNVLGSSGSVVPLFQAQIKRGGPITVTHPDMLRFFMTVGEASCLVLSASAFAVSGAAERGPVLVLDMGEPVRIIDIAERLIRLAGLKPYTDIPIQFVGLRPGEKLYEELFDRDEKSAASGLRGVLAARSKELTLAEVEMALSELKTHCEDGSPHLAVKALSKWVMGYTPATAFQGDHGFVTHTASTPSTSPCTPSTSPSSIPLLAKAAEKARVAAIDRRNSDAFVFARPGGAT